MMWTTSRRRSSTRNGSSARTVSTRAQNSWSGISFTGSNETAWAIQKALADRRNAIVPFIAETAGLNAMIDGLWLDILTSPKAIDRKDAKRTCLALLGAVFPREFAAHLAADRAA